MAGHRAGMVWQQCGGQGNDPTVLTAPGTSLASILAWAEGLLESSHRSRGDNPSPDPDTINEL